MLSFAQDPTGVYFGMGYNSSFVSNTGLNNFIKAYNDIRPWLSEKMKPVNYMNGVCMSFTTVGDFAFVDVIWTGRHKKTFGNGVDYTGTLTQRDIKSRNNTFDINFGFRLVNAGVVHPYLGTGFNFGAEKVLSRVFVVDGDDKDKYDKIDSDVSIGMPLILNILIVPGDDGAIWSIMPYYYFGFLKNDYVETNERINGLYYIGIDNEFAGKPNHFGFQVKLLLPFTRL